MKMTTSKLLALRVYNATLGRTNWGASLLRYLLVRVLVESKSNQSRYVASSRYFGYDELESENPTEVVRS
jgi:hypothetical protein